MDLIASSFLVVMVDTDDTRRTMDNRRRTTSGVWHKLPTGEVKMIMSLYVNFLGFLVLRWLGIRREACRRSDDGIKSLFDNGHIESRWMLVAFQDSLGFL